jgi:hypothetical protein
MWQAESNGGWQCHVTGLLNPYESDLQHLLVCLKINECNPWYLSHSLIGRSLLIRQVRLTVVQHLLDFRSQIRNESHPDMRVYDGQKNNISLIHRGEKHRLWWFYIYFQCECTPICNIEIQSMVHFTNSLIDLRIKFGPTFLWAWVSR